MDTTLKIGNDVFAVSPLLGEASFLLQPKLLPLVVDFVMAAGALSETVADGADPAIIAAKVGPVVQGMVGKLTPEDLKYIVRTLLQGATMNGTLLYGAQGNAIDVLMQRRTIDVWRLLIHAVQVSYPDFFALARAFRARPAAVAGDSATSTTSSPGQSGDS